MSEYQRILKTGLYKILVYFPVALLITYLFYQDFLKDIMLTLANAIVGILTAYLFDLAWHWHNTGLNSRVKIMAGIWILFIICFAGVMIQLHTKNNKSILDEDPSSEDL